MRAFQPAVENHRPRAHCAAALFKRTRRGEAQARRFKPGRDGAHSHLNRRDLCRIDLPDEREGHMQVFRQRPAAVRASLACPHQRRACLANARRQFDSHEYAHARSSRFDICPGLPGTLGCRPNLPEGPAPQTPFLTSRLFSRLFCARQGSLRSLTGTCFSSMKSDVGLPPKPA